MAVRARLGLDVGFVGLEQYKHGVERVPDQKSGCVQLLAAFWKGVAHSGCIWGVAGNEIR